MCSLLVPRLETGVPQPVIVTVVKSPECLHCQLQCLAPELRKLTREMKIHYDVQMKEVANDEVYVAGTTCAVLRVSDNVWYRAVVLHNLGRVAEVSFVDVGLVEMVSRSQLRSLPGPFARLPVQAFLCRLLYQGTGPPSWNDEQTAMLRSLVNGRSLVALLSSYSERDKCYSVVLLDQHNSRSINGELSRCAHSTRCTNTTLFQIEAGGEGGGSGEDGGGGCCEAFSISSRETKLSLKLVSPYEQLTFRPGQSLDVQVSSISTPGEFSCQLIKHVSSLKRLMHMLQLSCDNATYKPIAFPGPCAARCNVDRRWHRGFALGPVQNGTQVCVVFVDYGNDDLVMVQDLLPLPDCFLSDPAYAFRCCLYKLTSASNFWSTDSADAFQELVEDLLKSGTPMKCNVFMLLGLASGENTYVVDISTPFQDVSGMLVSRKFARYLEVPALLAPGETFRSFCYSSHGLKVGSEATVAVVCVKSLSCFFCHLKSNKDHLEAFGKALNDYCNNFCDWQGSVSVEEGPCFARCGDRWHRAMALSFSANGLVRVLLVDYGSEEEVCKLDVLPISPDALKFVIWPMQAVQCCLNDLEDVIESELDLTKGHFLELVDCPLRAVVSFRDSDGRLGLDLFRDSKRINAVIRDLLPTRKNVFITKKVAPRVDEENSAVNHGMVASNTSITCRRLGPHASSHLNVGLMQGKTQFGQKGNEPEDCVKMSSIVYKSQHRRQRNANGSAEEGQAQKLEAAQEAKKRKIVLSPVNPQNAQGREAFGRFPQSAARNESQSLSKVAVGNPPAQQLPVSLPTLASFPPLTTITIGCTCSVFVSYADNPQSIFVQLASDVDCIVALAEELNAEYETSLAVESVEESLLIPGVVVVALFSSDHCWYRAIVQSDPETDGTVTVEFVDYGNSEKVPAAMVRRISAPFLTQPRMSIPCCIVGSCLDPQKTWSSQVLDCVADLTKSDNLQCKFLHKCNSLWEVNLFEGGEDFADHLAKLQDCVEKPMQSCAALVDDAASLVQEEDEDESVVGKLPTVFEAPMEPGTRCDVYISVASSPLDFWCQLKANADGPLWDFMQAIEEQDVTGLAISGPLPPTTFCLARYGEDGALYRACVLETREGSTSVHFVDFGNSDDVNLEDIKQIPSGLANVPPFAFHCQLEGWSSTHEIGFAVFQNLAIEKPFNMEVVERDVITDTLTVRLYDEDGKLIINKLSNSQGVESDVKHLEVLEEAEMLDGDCQQQQHLVVVEATIQGGLQQGHHEETVENQELLGDASQSKGKELCLGLIAPQKELLIPKSAPSQSPWPENELCVGQSSPVFLTVVNPNCSFALQLQSWQEAIEGVQSELVNAGEELELLTNSPRLGQPCVARYSADDFLYRAEVASLEPGSITVRYVDFGNFETFSHADIKLYELPSSLLAVPPLSVKCYVKGLPEHSPAVAAKVCDYLWPFIESSVLCATFVCNGADGFWQVQLKNGEEAIDHRVIEIVGQVETAGDLTKIVEDVGQNLDAESMEDYNGYTNSEMGVKILDEVSASEVKDDSGLDFEGAETSSSTENKNGSVQSDLPEQLTSSHDKSFIDMANSIVDIIEFVEKKQNHGEGLPFDFPVSGRQDVPTKEKLQVEFSNMFDAEICDQQISSNCNSQQDDLTDCLIIHEVVDASFGETVQMADFQLQGHSSVLLFDKSEGTKEQQDVNLLEKTGSGISSENQLDLLLVHWPSGDRDQSGESGNLQGSCELETKIQATVGEQFQSPIFINHGATLSESNFKEVPVCERVQDDVCDGMVHLICVSDVKNERDDDDDELHETSLPGPNTSKEASQKSHFAVPVKELFPEEHAQEENIDKLNEQSIDVESTGVQATCTMLEDDTHSIFPFKSVAEIWEDVENRDFSLHEKGIEEGTMPWQTIFPNDYSADLKNDDGVKEMDEKIMFQVTSPLPELRISQDAKDNETVAELCPTLVQELSSCNLDSSNEHLLEHAPTEFGTTSEASSILSMEVENSQEGEITITMPADEDEATLVPHKNDDLAALAGGDTKGIAFSTICCQSAFLRRSPECSTSPFGSDALAESDEPCATDVCNPDGAVVVERRSPEMFFEELPNSKECSLGNDALDDKDTEVVKMGGENDPQGALLPELGTCQNNTPLDEHVNHLRSNKSDSSARYEEKIITFDRNVEDYCEDEARHLSLNEMTATEVPQEKVQDVHPVDSSAMDIEGKQLAPLLIQSQGEQLDELHEESELLIAGHFGNERSAELYEGLCHSSFNPVVEKDTPYIVPLEKEFQVECIMVNEEDYLLKESLPEMNTCQEANPEAMFELFAEHELPIAGLFGNENSAELYEGLCQSSFNPVVEEDTAEIVPVEECKMGNEPLDGYQIGAKQEMDEEDYLSQGSLSEMNTCQEANWETDLPEAMFELFAEHVLEESYSNVDLPNTNQVADFEMIKSELSDVNSGERIAQYEKVQGGVTATDGLQEEEQDACEMDKWESDVSDGNLLKQSVIQSQSSDLDESGVKAEGYDELIASHCCNANAAAVIESGSTEIIFHKCTIGNDSLDGVKKKDIEVVTMLGEESDLPELGTCQKANLEMSLGGPTSERSPTKCVEEERCSNVNFVSLLVEQVACLKSNKSESGASFEEKMSTFDVNVEDFSDKDAQYLSLDELPVTEVPQENFHDLCLIDSSAMDVEGKQLVPILIGSQGEQPDEFQDESKLPIAELFSNENISGHYQGLCQSSCNTDEAAVLDQDIPEIVPLKVFQVEECIMRNELDYDGFKGMKDLDEEDELCKESLSEMSSYQEVNQETDLAEPFAEHVLEESYNNFDMPNSKQVADLGAIESELADVNSAERIGQFEKVQGDLTAKDGPQEEEQDARQMDEWESDVSERNLQDQSQSSDLECCDGQLFTVYENCGSDAKAEGYDELSASHCCNGDSPAEVESGSTEFFFEECSIRNDPLDSVNEKDIEVAKVLGEESDLPEALLPELGTYQKANLEIDFVDPILVQSQEKCVEESNSNFLLVEQETCLESNQNELSTSLEAKMPLLDVNVQDCSDAQPFSLDELAVTEVPQESFPDVGPIDSSTSDIEGKQLDELPIAGLFGNEYSAELYGGLCQSFNLVVEEDTTEIVPVEECEMGNEPLDGYQIGAKQEMDEEDDLSQESLSEMNTCQEANCGTDLPEAMFELFAEHVLEESYSNVDLPNTKQVADFEIIKSELSDVNSGDRIAQYENVQGGLTATDGLQEEEQDACEMDKWESDVSDGNLLKQSVIQSQSSDLDESGAKAEGYDELIASHCCNANAAAVIESGSTEIIFHKCTIGNDSLDGVKKKDIEVVTMLGEESDLPELCTCQKANLEMSLGGPTSEQSPTKCVEERCSNVNFLSLLVEQVACLESNKSESDASFEEKMSTFDVNVEDFSDKDVQYLSLDELPVTEVPQENFHDLCLIDSSAMDVEGKQLVPILIGSQGEQPDEFQEESKLPIAELFANENISGHYQGLCQSSCNTDEAAVLDQDIPDIVPLKVFQVEECIMRNELDYDGFKGMKDLDEEDELCKESLSEMSTCQEVNRETDLAEPFAEHVLEESYNNFGMPNTKQVADLGAIESELADVNSVERIGQFEKVQGDLTAKDGSQEEEQDARQMDEWESDVLERNLQDQSQSSDLECCDGQLFTVYENCGSDAKAEGYDELSASHCCNGDSPAEVESGSTECFFEECSIRNDPLDSVNEKVIEVAKVLGEESDLPELGTNQKANLEIDFVDPILEQSQEKCVEESNSNFLLVEQETCLESNKNELSTSLEVKMPLLDVNGQDCSDAQPFSLDELAVTEVPQESFLDVGPTDSSTSDIEGKQLDELPIAGLFGNENSAELYEGLCQSFLNLVVEEDTAEIVPVEECIMGNEPLDGYQIGAKQEMHEEDDLSQESLSEMNTCQEANWGTDLPEAMFEPFAEHVLEESCSNVCMPNSKQAADLETIKSELADVNSGERIAQFEKVHGGVKHLDLYIPDFAQVQPREKLQDVCPDMWESDVSDRNLPNPSLVQYQSLDLDDSCEGQFHATELCRERYSPCNPGQEVVLERDSPGFFLEKDFENAEGCGVGDSSLDDTRMIAVVEEPFDGNALRQNLDSGLDVLQEQNCETAVHSAFPLEELNIVQVQAAEEL